MLLLDIENKLRKTTGDLAKLAQDSQDRSTELEVKIGVLEKQAKTWQYTISAMSAHIDNLIKQVKDLQTDAVVLGTRVDVLEYESTGLVEDAPGYVDRALVMDGVLTVANPRPVAQDLVKFLRTYKGTSVCMESDGSWYVDLGHEEIRDALPYGLTPRTARDALRRARVAKRSTRVGLKTVGWRKLPPFGVVLEL